MVNPLDWENENLMTDPGPTRRPSATKPAPLNAIERLRKMRGDFEKAYPPAFGGREKDSLGYEITEPKEEPRKEFAPAAGPLPGSAPMGQGGRRSDGVVDPKNYDPINYRRETFPLKAVPETAESTFSATEDAMRPPETRNYTGQDAKIVELMERQLASAEKARQEAKWMMLARMGFGMSSGRPDAMATSAQDALSFAARGNSDYNTALNQGVGNNLQYANLQRQRENDQFGRFDSDRRFDLGNKQLAVQQKAAEARLAAANRFNPVGYLKQESEWTDEAIRQYQAMNGKLPDFSQPGEPVTEKYKAGLQDFIKQYVAQRRASAANLYRNSPAQSYFDSLSEFGDVSQ